MIQFKLKKQDAQKHFIDAELSSMLSKTYMEDDNSGQYDQVSFKKYSCVLQNFTIITHRMN